MTSEFARSPREPVRVLDDAERETSTSPEFIPQYSILSWGADFDVAGLVKRLQAGDIEIPTFERGFVWGFRRAARFIESLLLGFPVPGIFLWRNPDTEKLVVVDGQQRLRTLHGYYEGRLLNRVFTMPRNLSPYQDVHPRFVGRGYRDLDPEDRRRLDNSIIHATIVAQERPPNDYTSVFYLFERLNTEGVPLRPQEIRTAIYQGPFIDLIDQLNSLHPWRDVYGKVSPRMKDRELILRFFALLHDSDDYSRPMKEFLNRHLLSNRHLTSHSSAELTTAFSDTITALAQTLGRAAFRTGAALNAAVYDAVMVGLARRLQTAPIEQPDGIPAAYSDLLSSQEFISATSRATADERNVRGRLDLATSAFAQLI